MTESRTGCAWWPELRDAMRLLPPVPLTRRMLTNETAYMEWRERSNMALHAVVDVIRRYERMDVLWSTDLTVTCCRDMTVDLDDQPYVELLVDVDDVEDRTLIRVHVHTDRSDCIGPLTQATPHSVTQALAYSD